MAAELSSDMSRMLEQSKSATVWNYRRLWHVPRAVLFSGSPMELLQDLSWLYVYVLSNPRPSRPLSLGETCLGEDSCDGPRLSRPDPTAYALTTDLPFLQYNQYYQYALSDENDGDGKGWLRMDPSTGLLGLTDDAKLREVFNKIPRGWIYDKSREKKGEIFSFQSSTNKSLFLALNPTSTEYVVQGMRLRDMGHISNCYWTNIGFSKIGKPPDGSGHYIALRYWGDRLGPPKEAPYYFIIDLKNKARYRIAPQGTAAEHGCLGFRPL
jgi:hypothetical protein